MSSREEKQKQILQPLHAKTEFDPINKPEHYNKSDIQPIDFIEANGLLDFRLANAIKYISRCLYKGTEKEDLEKAIWYLNRYLKWKFGE